MLLIDKYAYTNKLRNFNPMAKFCFAVGVLLISLINRNIYIHLSVIFIMLLMTVFIAGIPFRKYLRFLRIPLIFIILSIISILLSASRDENIFIAAFKIRDFYLGINKASIPQAQLLFFRAFACISAMYFLTLTTPMDQQIKIFKKFKIPNSVLELMVLMYRFIFILLEEYHEIYNAQNIRFGYTSLKKSYRSLSLLIKVLFIRVMNRNKDMSIALDSKLYKGEFYV